MRSIERGRFRAKRAETIAEMASALAFRSRCFRLNPLDRADQLDEICTHVVIEDCTTAEVVCYFRLNVMPADQVWQSYAAQFYGLDALQKRTGHLLEMGRFCIDPARRDPDILRLAWATVTSFVDQHDVNMLFGCTSFEGNEPALYTEAFSLLKTRYLAPHDLAPMVKAVETYDFVRLVAAMKSKGQALRQMPPLLRSYLSMGAWVSDHAVIDRALNTLHVFTGLEIDAIPVGRKRLLRAI